MRDVFYAAIALIAITLLIIDGWPAIVGSPKPDDDEWIDDLESVLCDGGEGQTKE